MKSSQAKSSVAAVSVAAVRAKTPAAAGGSSSDLPPGCRPSEKRLLLILLPLLAVAVLAAHWPVLSANAYSFDDHFYFNENYVVQRPGLVSAWRFLSEVLEPSTIGGYYQPLTMISLMLDYAMGARPDDLYVHHRTSLSLHVMNTLLMAGMAYLLLRRAVPAVLAALLFGVHPLTVEPIPWIGERKTLLAAFFGLLMLVAYIRYAQTGKRGWYAASVLLFLPALMSKPTTTPLPLVLLLLDVWPLGRLLNRPGPANGAVSVGVSCDVASGGRPASESDSPPAGYEAKPMATVELLARRFRWPVLWEKLPFFALAFLFGAITFISQARTGGVEMPGAAHSPLRVPLVIAHNIVFYLWKLFWPETTVTHYPAPEHISLQEPAFLASAIGALLLVALLVISCRWTLALLVGWLIYLIIQLPTMQIVGFSNVIASDKFVYLPAVGLVLALSWLLGRAYSRASWPAAATVVLVLLAAGLESRVTRQRLKCWKDTETLYKTMIEMAPNAAPLRLALGSYYGQKGRTQDALSELQTAHKLKPDELGILSSLGSALMQAGRFDESEQCFRRALELCPVDNTLRNLILNNFSQLQAARGDKQAAMDSLETAIRIKDSPRARHNLGKALLDARRPAEALVHLQKAVEMKPDYVAAQVALANVLADLNRVEEAIGYYEAALKLEPSNPDATVNLAAALIKQRRFQDALEPARTGVRLAPNSAAAEYNLGVCLTNLKRAEESVAHFDRALELNPKRVEAHNNLAVVLVSLGELTEARYHLEKAIEIQPDYVDARLNLAILLDMAGEEPAALEHYRQVLRVDPQNFAARSRLATVPAP